MSNSRSGSAPENENSDQEDQDKNKSKSKKSMDQLKAFFFPKENKDEFIVGTHPDVRREKEHLLKKNRW